MARRKNKPESVEEKNVLADRLRAIRVELFGERGGSEMARRLSLPVRTWYNYESGVTVPAETILRFMELTSAEPLWLLHGTGPRYRSVPEPTQNASSDSVRDLLCIALQRLEQREATAGEVTTARARALGSSSRAGNAGYNPPPTQIAALREHPPAFESRQVPLHSIMDQAQRVPVPGSTQAYQCVRVEGDAMTPLLSDGAYVVYSEHEDPPQRLAGQLVVAWVDNQPQVRWFDLSGSQGLLRAENPQFAPHTLKIDLEAPHAHDYRLRRVVGTSAPH